MGKAIPCVLMRAGTSRGPFFLREWLPEGDEARDQALIGAIGASDPLQLDGVGGGSTVDVAQWYGLFAPARTPGELIDKLNRCLNEVLATPDVLERFQSHGAQVEPGTTDALSTRVKTELARWSKVVKLARLAPSESRLATLD